eukprot:763056-Hanusia_phi.AAC.9
MAHTNRRNRKLQKTFIRCLGLRLKCLPTVHSDHAEHRSQTQLGAPPPAPPPPPAPAAALKKQMRS